VAVVMAGSSVAERHWIVRSSPGGGGVGISWCYVWERCVGKEGDVGGDVQTRSWLPSRPSTFPPLAAPRLVMEHGMGWRTMLAWKAATDCTGW